jgi:hypothetical protein
MDPRFGQIIKTYERRLTWRFVATVALGTWVGTFGIAAGMTGLSELEPSGTFRPHYPIAVVVATATALLAFVSSVWALNHPAVLTLCETGFHFRYGWRVDSVAYADVSGVTLTTQRGVPTQFDVQVRSRTIDILAAFWASDEREEATQIITARAEQARRQAAGE